MSDGLIFAYRADTGQRVRIPASHMRIWPNVFTLTPPTTEPIIPPVDPDPPVLLDGDTKPTKGSKPKAPANGDDYQKEV